MQCAVCVELPSRRQVRVVVQRSEFSALGRAAACRHVFIRMNCFLKRKVMQDVEGQNEMSGLVGAIVGWNSRRSLRKS
jgi:hypothetical protein